jgi:hypothetical protein
MDELRRRETTRMVTTAVQAGNWEGCLWHMPRPYRPEAFNIVELQLSGSDYWRLLGKLWTDTEFPCRQQSLWLYLFRSSRPGREQVMDDHNLDRYQALSPLVEIYRGARPRWARGLSWTLDMEVAAWFARRFDFKKPKAGRIYRVTVERSHIWAYFHDSPEDEVVIDPRQLPPLHAMCLPPEEIDAMSERVTARRIAKRPSLSQPLLQGQTNSS